MPYEVSVREIQKRGSGGLVRLTELSFDRQMLEENVYASEVKTFFSKDHTALYEEKKALLDQSACCSCAKVLVADDSSMNQFVLKMMMREIGIEADFANNGEEAVQQTR